jgi:hypothetical protein
VQKAETPSIAERYKGIVVSFSPFVLRSTGIIQSQTILKVDTYSLTCVPYQLSMSRVVLIGAFSKDEIVFFQRFKNSLAALTFAVQRPDAREQQKIFCRCQVSAIGFMKGRDQVGLVVCEFRPIPPALADLIVDHLNFMERLKCDWENLQNRIIQVTPDNSRKLGFNNYAVLNVGPDQHKLALFSIASNSVEFLMPLRSPDMITGYGVSLSLYFQRYRFAVQATIESARRLPSGVQRVRAGLSFSPELTDILSEFFFAEKIAARR